MGLSERNSQYGKALLGLRTLILNGAFAANTRLPETALARRLEISRTPLRQAMDRLIEEGLLERIETGGCKVASFTIADIHDAIELRGVIEGTAARLAAERGPDPDGLAECDTVLAGIDRALSAGAEVDFDAYVEFNARLHLLISELAGSPVIRREVDRISRLPLASPSAFLKGQELVPDFHRSLHRAQEQHKTIISAIRNREGTRAEAMAREHARLARQNLEFVMRSDRDFADRVPGLALVSTR